AIACWGSDGRAYNSWFRICQETNFLAELRHHIFTLDELELIASSARGERWAKHTALQEIRQFAPWPLLKEQRFHSRRGQLPCDATPSCSTTNNDCVELGICHVSLLDCHKAGVEPADCLSIATISRVGQETARYRFVNRIERIHLWSRCGPLRRRKRSVLKLGEDVAPLPFLEYDEVPTVEPLCASPGKIPECQLNADSKRRLPNRPEMNVPVDAARGSAKE